MCGIAGLISDKKSPLIFSEAVNRLAHRGPDNSGLYADHNIYLGHRRLRILDLSDRSNQPFHSQDGRYIMVFNGEVYNYRQIKRSLQQEKSIVFKTEGDTEVVLEAFAHWGIAVLRRFNGMFALAIWDLQQEQLFLIRDRLGIKPLYYFWDGEIFAFASELKAIAAMQELSINKSAIANFLYLGYLPDTQCFYNNTFKLPAGAYATFAKSQKIAIKIFWSPRKHLVKSSTAYSDFAKTKNKLHELLQDAVEQRMISDVPLGTFLSGGIDSSTITAIAQSVADRPVKSFSIGFKDQQFNEVVYAEKVAKHLGTEHYSFMLSQNDALERIESLLDIYDEPFADSSAIPTLLVSEMARRQVTVALSGDGGDELFMGYGMYNWAKRLHHPLLKRVKRLIAIMLARTGNQRMCRAATVFNCTNSARIKSHIFSQEQYLFSEREIEKLLLDTTSSALLIDEDYGAFANAMSPQESQSLFDIENYLREDLLVKVDRASMNHSLEVRVPLLDHRIVEFALALPLQWKVKAKESKYILKEILYQYVPKALFDRPKRGFSIPLVKWLKTDLRYLVDRYLVKSVIEEVGLVKYEEVNKLKQQYFSGVDYLYNRIWALVLLHRWFLHQNFHKMPLANSEVSEQK